MLDTLHNWSYAIRDWLNQNKYAKPSLVLAGVLIITPVVLIADMPSLPIEAADVAFVRGESSKWPPCQ
jgi:hypothetical protein